MKRIVFNKIMFVVIACTMVSHLSFSQDYGESNWLFGNSSSTIIFNKSDARAKLDTLQATPFGRGGSGVISDPVTGNLWFYTDGVNLYDADHLRVPNGDELVGDSSINQAVAIVPMKYTVGEYFIFTNPGAKGGEILYSVADRNLTGNAKGVGMATGDIDATRKNISTGLTNPSSALTVVQADISNYWVIAYDTSSGEYMVLGLKNGVLDNAGIQRFLFHSPTVPNYEPASFAYNADSSLLAVAPKDAFRNVSLFDFNINTGVMSFRQSILNSGNADGQDEAIYDVAWSSNGVNLYISRQGDTGNVANLYQYSLADNLNTINSILPASVYRSFGIQRGPDRRIYHLYQQAANTAIEIGVITEADSIYHVDSLLFNVGYYRLAFQPSAINAKQFPQFAAPHFEAFDSVSFSYLDICALQTTKFFSYVDPPAHSYFWNFGTDTSSAVNPVHTFQDAGVHNVKLTVSLNGVIETFSSSINVLENDLTIDLGADTIRCVGEVFEYDAGTGGKSYFWNTGETTQKIKVDTTGIFSVAVVSAATGCTTYAYVEVVTYGDDNFFRNQWYFGENAGIDFNGQGTTAISDANLMSSPQGASSISDLNGKLLFYTNGETVWNKKHEIMTNGTNIGGSANSSQGVLIVPLPSDSSIYYIFTSDPVHGDQSYNMKYSVVDMRKDTVKGVVIVKDMALFTNSTERMTSFGLGDSFSWLVGHEYGNNQFRAYPFTKEGIGIPVTSAAGSVMSFSNEKSGKAQMKYASNGGLLAVAYQDTTKNYLEIFSIIDDTGIMKGLVQIDIQEDTPSTIYGVEFSDNKNRIYVSTNGINGSTLLQYDLDSLYRPTAKKDIEKTKFELAKDATLQFGALQTGADRLIYMAIDNATAVGSIGNPSANDTNAGFNLQGLDLVGKQSRLGLPNFSQERTHNLTPLSINATNACLGQTTSFSGGGTSSIDVFYWTFDDGTSATEASVAHLYNLAGKYNVSLKISNRCGLDTTLLQTIEVFQIPSIPSIPDAAAICTGPITLTAWPIDAPGFTYTWSTGESTRQITVTTASYISVFLTDTNGCQSMPREILLSDARPQVNLGPDLAICQDITVADLNASNPGSVYTWSINGVPTGNIQALQTVDTSTPGTFTYKLSVEDLFNCIGKDSVILVVNTLPDFTLTPVDPPGCGISTGQVQIAISTPGSYTFSLSGTSILPETTINGQAGVISPLVAGAYTVTIKNTLTGCISPKIVTLKNVAALFTIQSPVPKPDCDAKGELTISLNGAAAGNVDYQLFNQQGVLVRSASATPIPDFTINGLSASTYSIVVQEQGAPNCIQTLDNIVLAELPTATFDASPQSFCGSEGTVSISPITINPVISYFWNGPDTNNSTGTSILVSTAGNYQVTATGAGYCDVTNTVTVQQFDNPTIEIVQDGADCEGELKLTAKVTNGLVGRGNYLWDNDTKSAQRIVRSSGTYKVTVLDQGTGCKSEASKKVEVFSKFTVFVAASPNCEQNEEVFLNAYANIKEDVTFTWTNPNGDQIDKNSAEITVTESGNYKLLLSSTVSNCKAEATIDLLVLPISSEELILKEQYIFCSKDTDITNNTVNLDAGAFTTFEWKILNDSKVLSNDRIYATTEAGIYEVTLSNGFTCLRDVAEVIDDCLPRIYAPNIFAPNGVNNMFFVYPNAYVTQFDIEIYSRWGERVYQSNHIDFKWDGIYKGSLLQNGAYTYVMRFKSSLAPQLGTIEQKGGIILLK